MDRITITKEMLKNENAYKELDIRVKKTIPYSECEECAMELVRRLTILDEDGIAYTSYRENPIMSLMYAKYFTNLDVDMVDDVEGQNLLHDCLRKLERSYDDDWMHVLDIYDSLSNTLKRKHERESSLAYKVERSLGSILGNKDIIETLAQNREVSEKLINMLGIFNEHKEKTESKASVPGLLNFAKR